MWKKIAAAAIIVSAVAVCFVYQYSHKSRSETFFALDTVIQCRIEGPQKTLDGLCSLIRENGDFFTVYQDSPAKQLNDQKEIQNEKLASFLKNCVEICSRTDGAFDITMKPVADLWGISGDHPAVPDEKEIQSCLEKVDYRNVIVDGETVRLLGGAEIDLGGIVKGHITDLAVGYLREQGVKKAVLDLGGNIYSLGEHRIGIKKPFGNQNEAVCSIEADDQAVVTAGVYERCFEQDGKLYHHIFDPKTGWPADNGILSVTVVGENAALCDALSTAFLVMGEEEIFRTYQEYGEIGVIVLKEGELLRAGQLDGFQLYDTTYKEVKK